MTTGKIKLKKKVLGDELFKALTGSKYMEQQKYEVTSGIEYEVRRKTIEKPGIEYTEEKPVNKVKIYKMFYGKQPLRERSSYIHFFGIEPGKKTSTLNFQITLEASYTRSDLEKLAEELNQKFSK